MSNVYTVDVEDGTTIQISAFCFEQAGMLGGLGDTVKLDKLGEIHNGMGGHVIDIETDIETLDDQIWVELDCHCRLPYNEKALTSG